jgi:hypothetical protein
MMATEDAVVIAIKTGRGNGNTGKKPSPRPPCASQIPHELT